MSDIKYEIINKCYDGVNIVAFTIKNSEGNTKLVPMEDVIKLARSNKLSNATYLIDIISADYVLALKDSAELLDTIYKNSKIKLELTCRIIDSNGRCIGYKAVDNTMKKYNLTAKRTWELAYNHNIEGVKALVIGGKKTLVSEGSFKLENLPKIKSS